MYFCTIVTDKAPQFLRLLHTHKSMKLLGYPMRVFQGEKLFGGREGGVQKRRRTLGTLKPHAFVFGLSLDYDRLPEKKKKWT